MEVCAHCAVALRSQLVLTSSGSVWSCGNGLYGRLGTSRVSPAVEAFVAAAATASSDAGECSFSSLMHIFPPPSDDAADTAAVSGEDAVAEASTDGTVVSVHAGGACSSLVDAAGQLFTWGYNAHGQVRVPCCAAVVRVYPHVCRLRGLPSQLGLGHTRNVYVPTVVPAFVHDDVRVATAACGQEHMVALSTSGNVRCSLCLCAPVCLRSLVATNHHGVCVWCMYVCM